MATIDLSRETGPLYAPRAGRFVAVDVPPLQYLMVDGSGDPNTTAAYREAVEALYAVAYGTKFALKKAGRDDFKVMPLQGLWWAGDHTVFTAGQRDAWLWTMMIAVPDFVSAEVVAQTREAAKKKNLPALSRLRLERFAEGPAMQTLYLGPYADEGPTIAALHDAIAAGGHALRGKHHEIYLSDPRKTAPEKRKTIIRQPFG